MSMSIFNMAKQTADPAVTSQIHRIQDWVRTGLGLADEVMLRVVELRCPDEDCPDIETVIAIFAGGQGNRKFKIMKPVVDVTHDDVTQAIAALPSDSTTKE